MKTLKDIGHLEGVQVLVRTDFNVPIANGAVADDFRIRMALPTIAFLRERKAKVILMSHLEFASGDNASLAPVADHLNTKLGVPVAFVKNMKDAMGIIANELQDGECVLLENLRQFPGEKVNDPKFAKELASLADIYIDEAFSAAHREHASIVGVPRFLPGYAGLQFEKEVANLSRAFKPAHPFLFILGGAKFETKLPLINKFIESADAVFIGGALANDFFKEKGYEVGRSLVSASSVGLPTLMEDPKLLLPLDIMNEKNVSKPADAVSPADKIMDAGPKTLDMLKGKIASAKFILWNGPLGLYEEGYTGPTHDLAQMIAAATLRGTDTIVGGGDTLAAIAALGISDRFSFVSTGGGAMLDFLAKGTLPGIEALEESGQD